MSGYAVLPPIEEVLEKMAKENEELRKLIKRVDKCLED